VLLAFWATVTTYK